MVGGDLKQHREEDADAAAGRGQQAHQQLHLRSLYARLTSSTELANAGWRYNRDSKRWEQVGDLRMTFQQEV